MIEDVDPRILAPLSAGQIMIYCFEGCDWRRFFKGISGCSVETWTHAYHVYLVSRAWRKKSDARRLIDEDRCRHPRLPVCYNSHGLQVHHLSYANIGDEDVQNDLITLCDKCHALEHPEKDRA